MDKCKFQFKALNAVYKTGYFCSHKDNKNNPCAYKGKESLCKLYKETPHA